MHESYLRTHDSLSVLLSAMTPEQIGNLAQETSHDKEAALSVEKYCQMESCAKEEVQTEVFVAYS